MTAHQALQRVIDILELRMKSSEHTSKVHRDARTRQDAAIRRDTYAVALGDVVVIMRGLPPEEPAPDVRPSPTAQGGSWAMTCEHANEVPRVCPCPMACYCKFHTCREGHTPRAHQIPGTGPRF
jgi:hypothetical protein